MNSEEKIDNKRRPIALDLFSGVGGLSLGFEQAGFDVVAAVEYDPIHAAVHEFNFPLTKVLCADLADEERASVEVIRSAIEAGIVKHGHDLSKWDRDVDAIFGGPPCQGFSVGGRREFDDKRNDLVFHFARIVEGIRPKYFVMENVPGMGIGEQGSILAALITRLRGAEYSLTELELNVKSYGVPQDRKRLILVGTRAGLRAPNSPSPTVVPVSNKETTTKTATEIGALPLGPTVWDALRDLGNMDRRASLVVSDEAKVGPGALADGDQKASTYAATLRGIVEDPNDFAYPRHWDRTLITSSMMTEHEPNVIERFSHTPKGKTEKTSRFFRLHPRGLSRTLRAGTGSERGAYTSPRPIHPYRDRVITVREAARLHSFPDWFRFHRTKWHGFRQVGNSVPPLLGRALGSELISALGVTPVKPANKITLGSRDLLSKDRTEALIHFEIADAQGPHYRKRTTNARSGRRARRRGGTDSKAA